MNGYRCVACATDFPADFAGFLCAACGGNLDITYDYAGIAEQVAGGFAGSSRDIFRYQPLLPIRAAENPLSLKIGGTPLYKAARLGALAGLQRLYLKDDSHNPSASLKDRATAIALRRAIDCGAGVVCAASTGNAGSSLACLGAALGLRSVVFVPQSAPAAKLAQTRFYGADVLAVRGTYDDAFDLCLAASREFGWFNRSTGFNPFTREGKKTCAFEIWEDLDKRVPDRIVVPTGDGNILSGMWKGWCDLKAVGLIDRLPQIDCAQSEASAAISRTVNRLRADKAVRTDWTQVNVDEVCASTLADSISVNRPRDGLAAVKAVIQSRGVALAVSDDAIFDAIHEMARCTGIFAEPAAAASWAVARQMAEDQIIGAEELTVCIVTGSGLKDVGSAARFNAELRVIDPDIDAVRRALES